MRNIPCKFEISTYNTLCSRGPQKSLLKVEKTPVAAILFFKMRPKIFLGKIVWLRIYSANLRRLAIIFFFVRAVTVKSLYTLRRQRRNEAKSIVSSGCYSVDTTREPMEICIHRKDNWPKPVNHRLTLKEVNKVKSVHIRRFPAHDFL